MEGLQELKGEEGDGLGASREYIVDDVVKALGLIFHNTRRIAHCVFNHRGVICR